MFIDFKKFKVYNEFNFFLNNLNGLSEPEPEIRKYPNEAKIFDPGNQKTKQTRTELKWIPEPPPIVTIIYNICVIV